MEDAPTPFAELDQGPSKFEEFLEKNQKLLIGSSVAIFLGVLGYVGYTGYNDLQASEAGSALTSANDAAEIQTVITNYGETPTAGSAKILLALTQADEDTAKSIETLNDLVATDTDHPALAKAKTQLGLALLNEGKLTDAQAHLSEVVDMENADYIIPAAQIGLGDIAKANGNIAEAKAFYKEVADLTANGDSASINKFTGYASMAKARLRFLEVEAPTEVEKKEAPAVTPAPQPTISTSVESDDKKADTAE